MTSHQIKKRVAELEKKHDLQQMSNYTPDDSLEFDRRHLGILRKIVADTFQGKKAPTFDVYRAKCLEIVDSHDLKITEQTIKEDYDALKKIFAYFDDC